MTLEFSEILDNQSQVSKRNSDREFTIRPFTRQANKRRLIGIHFPTESIINERDLFVLFSLLSRYILPSRIPIIYAQTDLNFAKTAWFINAEKEGKFIRINCRPFVDKARRKPGKQYHAIDMREIIMKTNVGKHVCVRLSVLLGNTSWLNKFQVVNLRNFIQHSRALDYIKPEVYQSCI